MTREAREKGLGTMSTTIPPEKWRWYGNAGHFICGHACRFHLCTEVGPWLVSTVGQLWLERGSREIHAKIYDAEWLATNRHRLGDDFDHEYMKRFGYEKLGASGTFETMVFRWKGRCKTADCACGIPTINPSDLDGERYDSAGDATRGHMKYCRRWAKKASEP